jgi:hypothetical protein
MRTSATTKCPRTRGCWRALPRGCQLSGALAGGPICGRLASAPCRCSATEGITPSSVAVVPPCGAERASSAGVSLSKIDQARPVATSEPKQVSRSGEVQSAAPTTTAASTSSSEARSSRERSGLYRAPLAARRPMLPLIAVVMAAVGLAEPVRPRCARRRLRCSRLGGWMRRQLGSEQTARRAHARPSDREPRSPDFRVPNHVPNSAILTRDNQFLTRENRL